MSKAKTISSIVVIVTAAALFGFQPSAFAQASRVEQPLSAPDQIQGATKLYDDFASRWLNPAKWLSIPTCSATAFLDSAASLKLLDCVREAETGHLHLLVKAYGNSVSDTDRQFGPSELYFANPNAVKTIATNMRVRTAMAVGCPSNTTAAFGQTVTGGNYFNSGTGDPNDDVAALLLIQHAATDPAGTLEVLALVLSPNSFYGFAALGAVEFNESVSTQLQWDQSNHQFVFSVASNTLNNSAAIAYSASDTMAAVAPMKMLGARAFAPNCTTHRTTADIEALFDKVLVN